MSPRSSTARACHLRSPDGPWREHVSPGSRSSSTVSCSGRPITACGVRISRTDAQIGKTPFRGGFTFSIPSAVLRPGRVNCSVRATDRQGASKELSFAIRQLYGGLDRSLASLAALIGQGSDGRMDSVKLTLDEPRLVDGEVQGRPGAQLSARWMGGCPRWRQVR